MGTLLDVLVHKITGEDSAEAHEIVDMDELQRQLEQAELPEESLDRATSKDTFLEHQPVANSTELTEISDVKLTSSPTSEHSPTTSPVPESTSSTGDKPHEMDEDQSKHLVKMGLMAALAITIHNFPEGLATFVGTLDDPVVGYGLAVAIAIHNIPEGLCVAVPIYYATKDRWTAFKWAFISGISEPLGAGLGWAVLYRVMNDTTYGVMFGLVAGMMVNICLHELIPTAFKYDPKDKVVTNSLICGMAVMATSLLMFVSI